MNKRLISVLMASAVGILLASAEERRAIEDKVDGNGLCDSLSLQEVVVTGTRNATDVRHLTMTVTVIGRDVLTEQQQTSVLPTVMQQVPGLFVTSRSMMGYGVSTGAAGGINLRGITGGAGQLLVLIDGHPQYNGVYGHPISDSYQTLMADRVEVLRGPASVLYGKWSVVAGLQYISGLYTAVGDDEQKENFCLLGCTVKYVLCKNIGLWLRGENLLAQRYEINLGYPMPRATFMGGVNVSF